jgi:hypothetical protein
MIQLRLFTIALAHVSILVNVIIRAAWVVVKWEIISCTFEVSQLLLFGIYIIAKG